MGDRPSNLDSGAVIIASTAALINRDDQHRCPNGFPSASCWSGIRTRASPPTAPSKLKGNGRHIQQTQRFAIRGPRFSWKRHFRRTTPSSSHHRGRNGQRAPNLLEGQGDPGRPWSYPLAETSKSDAEEPWAACDTRPGAGSTSAGAREGAGDVRHSQLGGDVLIAQRIDLGRWVRRPSRPIAHGPPPAVSLPDAVGPPSQKRVNGAIPARRPQLDSP